MGFRSILWILHLSNVNYFSVSIATVMACA